MYRIETTAFSETYTAVFVPPTPAAAGPRGAEKGPDAVLAALGGIGFELVPPPKPEGGGVPWRWRGEGAPELAAVRLAACEARAGVGAAAVAAAGLSQPAPGGWGATSVDGWRADAAGATLTLTLAEAVRARPPALGPGHRPHPALPRPRVPRKKRLTGCPRQA